MNITSARFLIETSDERKRRTDLITSDIDAYFDATDKHDLRRANDMDILIGLTTRHGCIRINNSRNDARWYYLHRSVKYFKALQLTAWDEYGAVFDERIGCTSDLVRSSLPDDMTVMVDTDMVWE